MNNIHVFVLTVWNEDTGEDIVEVYTNLSKDRAVKRLHDIQEKAVALGQHIFASLVKRSLR